MTIQHPRPLTLITGSSRGLGAALAAECLRRGHQVIGIARQRNEALDTLAQQLGAPLQQWRHDLTEPEAAGWALLEWLQSQPAGLHGPVTLINNAALLTPPGPLTAADPADTARLLRVGLEAALVLSTQFLRGTQAWTATRRVLNISSGLGRRAMAGSAAYCAAKAGLDHFSRALALEQAGLPNGARVVSLAPGVIDTDMQQTIRSADPAGFPDHERFVELQRSGQLSSPEACALQVLAWLDRPDFGTEVIADVRQA